MERVLLEYLANALWQLPVLAAGAWVLLWLVRPGPRTQYRVWLAVLGLAVMLPGCGLGGDIGGSFGTNAVATPLVHRSAAVVEVEPMSTIELEPRTETVRETSWLSARIHRVPLSAREVHWISGVYAGSVLLGLLRVGKAWRSARRLVANSREVALCSTAEAVLEGFGRDLNMRLPEVRECAEVTSPMVVGAISPVVLLPEDFAGHGENEVKAALLHELAHVKRRDYMINSVCQVAGLPVIWHPVTYAVQQRIRRTREMVCDEMAAHEMESEIGYARCLLTMARGMLGGGLAERPEFVGLFSSNVLEERVMRLMETKIVVSVRMRVLRLASGASAMAAATLMAASFHVVPTMAAEQQVAVASIAPIVPVIQAVDALSPVAPVSGLTAVRPPVAFVPAVVVVPATLAAVPVAPYAETSPYEPQDVMAIAPVAPQSAPTPPSAPTAATPAVAPVPRIAPTPATPHAAPAAGRAPTPPVAPAPEAAPAAPAKKAICKKKTSMVYRLGSGGDGVIVVDGQVWEMTPEERAQMEKTMTASAAGMREAAKALNSAEFKTNMAEMQQQMAKLKVKNLADSSALHAQMDATRLALEAQHDAMNSAELQAKMVDMQVKLQSMKIRNCDASSSKEKEKQKDKAPQKQ
jgi:beta-lactamase regulating signal transducer with metallopeptidase domain